MTCLFYVLLIGGGGVFVMASLLRWFEQTAEAVDNGWWNKTVLLVVFPFGVWFFPSKVAAGRPTPVPRHEPVRGMGSAPKLKAVEPTPESAQQATERPAPAPVAKVLDEDGPPPGTPKEFLGMPVIPARAKKPKSAAVDPDKVAKLMKKMREQGMLPDDGGDAKG
jgi:hypothetical protein